MFAGNEFVHLVSNMGNILLLSLLPVIFLKMITEVFMCLLFSFLFVCFSLLIVTPNLVKVNYFSGCEDFVNIKCYM